MKRIFELAIIHHKKVSKDEVDTKFIQEPKYVLAKDEKSLMMMACRSIPRGYEEKLEEVEIVIRPF